jgi:hypothetical protein
MEHDTPDRGPYLPLPPGVIAVLFLLTALLALIFLVAAQVVQTP